MLVLEGAPIFVVGRTHSGIQLCCDIEGGGGLGRLPGLRRGHKYLLACWSHVMPDQGVSEPQLKFSVLPAHPALLHLLYSHMVWKARTASYPFSSASAISSTRCIDMRALMSCV